MISATKTIGLAGLKKIKLEVPRSVQTRLDRGTTTGRSWKPIAHFELADSIRKEIESRGWEVIDSRFMVSPNKDHMTGTFDIRVPKIKMDEHTCLSVGVLTSNAMSWSIQLFTGATTLASKNGIVTNSWDLGRHTTGLDLEYQLKMAIDEYPKASAKIPDLIERLGKRKLKPYEASQLIIESARREFMPWRKLGELDLAYADPPFAEFGTETAWTLIQCFTYILKQTAPMKQFERSGDFLKLMESYFKWTGRTTPTDLS